MKARPSPRDIGEVEEALLWPRRPEVDGAKPFGTYSSRLATIPVPSSRTKIRGAGSARGGSCQSIWCRHEDYAEDKPFFLWAAFPGPHDPYNPPEELTGDNEISAPFTPTDNMTPFWKAMVRTHTKGSAAVDILTFPPESKARIRRHYEAQMTLIDAQMGAIMKAVEAREDGRETLVIFSSDHGDFLGDFDFLGKVLFFESSACVPMITAGSGVPAGRSDVLISLTDVFATFLAAGRVAAPGQDSQPLPGIGYGDARRGLLMGATDKGVMATDGRWKLSRYHNGVVCLHDVITDPQEQYDRFQEKPEIRDRLERALSAWIVSLTMFGHGSKAHDATRYRKRHRIENAFARLEESREGAGENE